ncbi:solute carrier family 35 member F3-like [Hyperolius riggenbachi]|uniref:solute carrier family 35 member F3-like n=1 Tax=Hyperolius riggenbachi TaxID=752182 RepID=UPI0035A30E86
MAIIHEQAVGKENHWRALGLHSVTPALIIKRIFPVCSFSLLALSLYLLALHSLHSSEAVVLYSCNKAFCYLLTWTILREPFLGARVVALVFCMAGVVMMSYRESPDEEASSGRILALSAAAVTAINEVVTRLLIGKLSCQETVVFLGLCGLCSSFVLWWAPLIVLLHQRMEELELLIFPVIKYLCASVFFFFLYDILEKIGSHFAPSSGVSLGVFLSTAVVSGMEQQWEVPPGMNMMGYCSIGVGFFLLLIPEVFWSHLGFTHQEQAYQEEFNEEIKNKCTVSIM